MFFKIGVLKNFALFAGKEQGWSLFLIKLQSWRSSTLLKRNPNTDASCEYCKKFKNSFFHRIHPVAAFVLWILSIMILRLVTNSFHKCFKKCRKINKCLLWENILRVNIHFVFVFFLDEYLTLLNKPEKDRNKPTFTFLKSIMKTEQCVKSVQSLPQRYQNSVIIGVLLSFLLTLNRFHTLLWFFHCQLRTGKYRSRLTLISQRFPFFFFFFRNKHFIKFTPVFQMINILTHLLNY